MRYSAVLFDENGADQGPVDVSSAQDDEQARSLAKQEGAEMARGKWNEQSDPSNLPRW
jgi:hypothetical protein